MWVYTAIALAAAAASAFGAWQVQDWRYGAKEAQRLEAQAAAGRRQIRVIDKAAEGHEVDKREIQTEFITITERVDHVVEKPFYVPAEQCLDADGLRELTAAVGAAATASQPARAVSGPAGAGGR